MYVGFANNSFLIGDSKSTLFFFSSFWTIHSSCILTLKIINGLNWASNRLGLYWSNILWPVLNGVLRLRPKSSLAVYHWGFLLILGMAKPTLHPFILPLQFVQIPLKRPQEVLGLWNLSTYWKNAPKDSKMVMSILSENTKDSEVDYNFISHLISTHNFCDHNKF